MKERTQSYILLMAVLPDLCILGQWKIFIDLIWDFRHYFGPKTWFKNLFRIFLGFLINRSMILAKFHHIPDQHHRKPPYANFCHNQTENDKIDNLPIDFWSIDRWFWQNSTIFAISVTEKQDMPICSSIWQQMTKSITDQ